jgi:hypothetical protein
MALAALGLSFWVEFLNRIRRAHFGWMANALATFGLPLFAILLLNSSICHSRGSVSWKGRRYSSNTDSEQFDRVYVSARSHPPRC